MNEDQPLGVKFHAACALEKVIRHEVAIEKVSAELMRVARD